MGSVGAIFSFFLSSAESVNAESNIRVVVLRLIAVLVFLAGFSGVLGSLNIFSVDFDAGVIGSPVSEDKGRNEVAVLVSLANIVEEDLNSGTEFSEGVSRENASGGGIIESSSSAFISRASPFSISGHRRSVVVTEDDFGNTVVSFLQNVRVLSEDFIVIVLDDLFLNVPVVSSIFSAVASSLFFSIALSCLVQNLLDVGNVVLVVSTISSGSAVRLFVLVVRALACAVDLV